MLFNDETMNRQALNGMQSNSAESNEENGFGNDAEWSNPTWNSNKKKSPKRCRSVNFMIY
jgi:hypothetical protein